MKKISKKETALKLLGKVIYYRKLKKFIFNFQLMNLI